MEDNIIRIKPGNGQEITLSKEVIEQYCKDYNLTYAEAISDFVNGCTVGISSTYVDKNN